MQVPYQRGNFLVDTPLVEQMPITTQKFQEPSRLILCEAETQKIVEGLGDTAAVTLPNLAFMYDDLGPIRLMLQQTAAKADVNGVFSGNCPSGAQKL